MFTTWNKCVYRAWSQVLICCARGQNLAQSFTKIHWESLQKLQKLNKCMIYSRKF